MSPSRGTERPRSNVVRSGDGQSILYESITQVPGDLEGGLKPVEARETLASSAQVLLVLSYPQGWLDSHLLPLYSTHAESSGTVTSDPKLDLGN